MKPLYEIANDYQAVLSEVVDDLTGEVDTTALARLDDITEDINKKGINVASYIQNIEAEEAAINGAINKMVKRRDQLAKQAQSLETYLKYNMERCGITEISCAYFVVKLKKCPVAVEILDEDNLPAEYMKTKTVTTIDKLKLREELKQGVIVPGAILKQNNRIEIK